MNLPRPCTAAIRRPLAVAAVAAALAAACGDGTTATSDMIPDAPTLVPPATVLEGAAPGDVIEQVPLELPPEAVGSGLRITYASTHPDGQVIPVTGVLLVPDGEPPEGGWPVAAWGHPTVGLGDECAPSVQVPFTLPEANTLVASGVVVAATDYPGLGSPGVHPYLVGPSEGRSVLDAVRAAGAVGGTGPVVAWGHSQGGHAVLWARAIAADYAPELDLRGTAAAAPVTDIAAFVAPGFEDPELFALSAMVIISWATVYTGTSLGDLLEPEYAAAASQAIDACYVEFAVVGQATDPQSVLLADPADVEDWRALLVANSVPATATVGPVLLSHGDADALVPAAGTDALAEGLCAEGVAVTLWRDPAWDHGQAYAARGQDLVAWLMARLAGEPAPTDC